MKMLYLPKLYLIQMTPMYIQRMMHGAKRGLAPPWYRTILNSIIPIVIDGGNGPELTISPSNVRIMDRSMDQPWVAQLATL